jgi:hypothetical protein
MIEVAYCMILLTVKSTFIKAQQVSRIRARMRTVIENNGFD